VILWSNPSQLNFIFTLLGSKENEGCNIGWELEESELWESGCGDARHQVSTYKPTGHLDPEQTDVLALGHFGTGQYRNVYLHIILFHGSNALEGKTFHRYSPVKI